VLQPENIKQLKKMKQFPLQFENESHHAGGDGQNCSLTKEKEERDESDGDEDSDDDLPMIMNRVQVQYSDSSSGTTKNYGQVLKFTLKMTALTKTPTRIALDLNPVNEYHADYNFKQLVRENRPF